MLLFSLVFTSNIFLSNYGLVVVSVSVHQISRTLVPLFTMALSLLVYKETYPWSLVPSVMTVCFGVGLTLWGDVQMTTVYGFVVVLAGCLLSSLKGLMSQKAQVGPQGLPTMDLLRFMCPLAVIQLTIAALIGGEFAALYETFTFSTGAVFSLTMQGLIAFLLNVVSFKCSALLTPLTMNIAGNMKQAITPLLALQMFGGSASTALLFGLVVSTVGAIWYGQQARNNKVAKSNKEQDTNKVRIPISSVSDSETDKKVSSVSAPPTVPDRIALGINHQKSRGLDIEVINENIVDGHLHHHMEVQ